MVIRALIAASLLTFAGCPGGMTETKQDRGATAKKDTSTPADTRGWEGGVVKDGGKNDGAKCPPVPTCNWCNGAAVKDAKGCVTAFKCQNGADPCKVQPCTKGSCPAAQYCDQDKLCWPKKDLGIPDQGKKLPLCLNSKCKATPGKSCDCDWSCTDGTTYKAVCTAVSGGYSCTCSTNSVKSGTCTLTKPCYQTDVAACCGFPMQ